MKLYEIEKEIYKAIEDGELEKLGELREMETEKLESVGKIILNLSAEAKARKEEAKRQRELANACEAKIESIKNYFAGYIKEYGINVIGSVKFGFRKSKSVEIKPGREMIEQYSRVKVEWDKTKLKKDLEAGAKIDGISIVQKEHLQVK